MNIKYTFVDETTSEIEVSDELGNILLDLNHKDKLNYRKNNRRHCSLEVWDPDNNRIADDSDFVSACLQIEELEWAICQLPEKQQELIYAIYFDGKSAADYAAEKGVSNSAVSQLHQKALKNLKKIFEGT